MHPRRDLVDDQGGTVDDEELDGEHTDIVERGRDRRCVLDGLIGPPTWCLTRHGRGVQDARAMIVARRVVGNDSAGAIDDNIGPKYGDYARSAAQSVTDAAERLRAKPVEEIAEDTREFVRTKPVAAAGIAAVASLLVAKLLSSVFGKRR